MSDYISREDALRELCATKCGRNFSDCNSTGPCIYGRIISKLPSVDVRENIHGEWEEVTDYKDDNVYQWHIICSVCHCRGMFESDNFCPNCGADMRGESNV